MGINLEMCMGSRRPPLAAGESMIVLTSNSFILAVNGPPMVEVFVESFP